MGLEGVVGGEAFESYIEKPPRPLTKRVGGLIEVAGASLLFLPPYSPDFNSIEQAFSKLKNLLRKTRSRTKEILMEATGEVLDAITVEDIHGFYSGCGYRLPLQL